MDGIGAGDGGRRDDGRDVQIAGLARAAGRCTRSRRRGAHAWHRHRPSNAPRPCGCPSRGRRDGCAARSRRDWRSGPFRTSGTFRDTIDHQGFAVFHRLAVADQDRRSTVPASGAGIGFITFIASMISRVWPFFTLSPTLTKGGPGLGGEIGGADHGRGDGARPADLRARRELRRRRRPAPAARRRRGIDRLAAAAIDADALTVVLVFDLGQAGLVQQVRRACAAAPRRYRTWPSGVLLGCEDVGEGIQRQEIAGRPRPQMTPRAARLT